MNPPHGSLRAHQPGGRARCAVCGTAATARGGSAIVMAQMQATQLVTSGLWGLLYYREIRGRALWIWVCFALWTIVAVVLLGMEKA